MFRLGGCLRACGFEMHCVGFSILLFVVGSLCFLRSFCNFVGVHCRLVLL